MDYLLMMLIMVYMVLAWRFVARVIAEKTDRRWVGHIVAAFLAPLLSLIVAIPIIPEEGAEASGSSIIIGALIAFALFYLEPSVRKSFMESVSRESGAKKNRDLNYRPELIKNKNRNPEDYSGPITIGPASVSGAITMTYTNASGDTTTRRVDIKRVDGDKFKGFCHNVGEVRTFRIDRIEGDVIDLATGELVEPWTYFEDLSQESSF